ILSGSNSYLLGTVVNAGTLITNTNFSETGYTLANTSYPAASSVGTTAIIPLNVAANAIAIVSQKTANNDPSGTTAIPWNGSASATNTGLQLASGGTVGARLDLNNNAMVIYGETNVSDVSSTIRNYLKTGHDAGWAIGTSTN